LELIPKEIYSKIGHKLKAAWLRSFLFSFLKEQATYDNGLTSYGLVQQPKDVPSV